MSTTNDHHTTKGRKIARALKSAARLPRVPALRAGRASARTALEPRPGEPPVVVLKLQVLGCANVLAKDRGGTSDPFVVVTLLNARQQTPVAKRTINPTYAPKDATFEFPIYLSQAERLGVVELIVWDKDLLKKDYLGEVAVPLEDWFNNREFAFDHPGNTPFALELVSTRARTPSAGQITIKLGFVATGAQNLMEFDEIYAELVRRSRPSLVSAPPTEGVGTVRSTGASTRQLQLQDDGGLSSDSDDSDDDEFVDASDTTPPTSSGLPPSASSSRAASRSPRPLLDLYIPPESTPNKNEHTIEEAKKHTQAAAGVAGDDLVQPQPRAPFNLPELNIEPSSPATPTPGLSLATATPLSLEETPRPTGGFGLPPTPSSASTGSRFIPRKFVRKLSGLASAGVSSSGFANGEEGESGLVPPAVDAKAAKKVELGKSAERRKKFGRSWSSSSGNGASSGSDTGLVAGDSGSGTPTAGLEVSGGRRRAKASRRKSDFEFKGANDIVGIVMLEIQGADDLPRLANMTRTGWDMDPFVVVSFGKKVFRTRVIRHSRAPVWDEKLLFHVRRYETAFRVQLTVLDWDKLSSNDHIGDASIDVQELVAGAPQPDPTTGLYKLDEDDGADGGEAGMKQFERPLRTEKGMPWEAKHAPVIRFKAKYQPYGALRQRFWRQYLKQYDADDTGALSHIELTSMLDSLGSTLTRATVSSFFTRFGKEPHAGELTMDEAVICLEAELGRPDAEKKRVDADEGAETSTAPTPVLGVTGARGQELKIELGELDFSGVPHVVAMEATDGGDANAGQQHVYSTEPMQIPLSEVAAGNGNESSDMSSDADEGEGETLVPSPSASTSTSNSTAAEVIPEVGKKKPRKMRFKRMKRGSKAIDDGGPLTPGTPLTPSGAAGDSAAVERVINVKNCPLCHRPRLNSKAEIDIITHLAICASKDWNQVDRIVVGNYVTASQAQRKWYTKILGKVSSGDYRLGANSANIIVQNRMTGQLEEEKMQVYVRLGIRLLYKGATSRMEGARARKLLKSLSIKQGIKYDDPESAKGILAFIQFHGLKVEEILDPIDSFKTFNEFFYRKLKPSARPIDADPLRLVSAADCRLMTFETVHEATRLWIKGREFTIARLLGDVYKHEAERYAGGALAIFRLAPQDYHRFHSPVAGTIGKMVDVAGEYYTVNPQAIRSALDVYGENARRIVPIESERFGKVMAVCVGAMMVGTIRTTVKEGEYVEKGQEFGYFAFGGSTIVVLFEKGRVTWDEDLLVNGRASLETLVHVGMGIGTGRADA